MDLDSGTDVLLPYDCLLCHEKAHLPVLTRCGHLFCWRCFHLGTVEESKCPSCKEIVDREDLFSLFIENERVEVQEEELPERPTPVNIPKILNADIVSFSSNFARDNIAMGRPFAGSVFQPSLAVTSLSQMGEADEHQPEKQVGLCLKCLFIILVGGLLTAFCIQLTI